MRVHTSNIGLPCIDYIHTYRPVSAVDLVRRTPEGVDHLCPVRGCPGGHLIANIDVRRKSAVEELLVGRGVHGAVLVVGEGLVELTDEVGHVFLVAVGDVAGGADVELVLGGVYAFLEGDLRAFAGLKKRKNKNDQDIHATCTTNGRQRVRDVFKWCTQNLYKNKVPRGTTGP